MIYTCYYSYLRLKLKIFLYSCPDCHKEKINRKAGMKIIEASAVREATKQEQEWYEDYLRTNSSLTPVLHVCFQWEVESIFLLLLGILG